MYEMHMRGLLIEQNFIKHDFKEMKRNETNSLLIDHCNTTSSNNTYCTLILLHRNLSTPSLHCLQIYHKIYGEIEK